MNMKYCAIHHTYYGGATDTIPVTRCPLCAIRVELEAQPAPRTYEVARALSWVDAVEQAAPSPATTEAEGALPKITDIIQDEVEGYEVRGDDGDYTPTEHERALLLDFANGLIENEDLVAWLVRNHVSPPAAQEQKPVASSDCPVCGVDAPHGHSPEDLENWLHAQAARFGHDFDLIRFKPVDIDLAEFLKRWRSETHLGWSGTLLHRALDELDELIKRQAFPIPVSGDGVTGARVIRAAYDLRKAFNFQHPADAKHYIDDLFAELATYEKAVEAAAPVAPGETK